MAVTVVDKNNDTIDNWRVKTNTISSDLGDASTLTTVATNAVGGINEVKGNIGDLTSLELDNTDLVTATNDARHYAYALTIALG